MTVQTDRGSGIGHAVWDVRSDGPNLGGALTLRQELEIVRADAQWTTISIHIVGDVTELVTKTYDAVFGSSADFFEISYIAPPSGAYPPAAARSAPGFTHYSLERVIALSSAARIAPRLAWSAQVLEQADRLIGSLGENVIAIHLKNVGAIESRVEPQVWAQFIAEAQEDDPSLAFLLVGDDSVPTEVPLSGRVVKAGDLGAELAVQLCCAARAAGFIGLASGVCTAALFSDAPHVIIKDPDHHVQEMDRELGERTSFAFAAPRQQLWRRKQTAGCLRDALSLIGRSRG